MFGKEQITRAEFEERLSTFEFKLINLRKEKARLEERIEALEHENGDLTALLNEIKTYLMEMLHVSVPHAKVNRHTSPTTELDPHALDHIEESTR
ncbi:MAG TPA: hypothetical protein VJZ27_12395 [Aggregatilineales bacterium]|nr:hypothetical protein [Aggregatilineales bacterium]